MSYTKMSCVRRAVVQKNLDENVWLHSGSGKFTPDELNKNIGRKIKPEEIFNPPPCPEMGFKPNKPIWFSAGSWLFDPYCDNDYEKESEYFLVLKIKNPKNILKIDNYDDFLKFESEHMSKYGMSGTYVNFIDWKKIKDDGFYGVSFSFRKVHHITNKIDPYGLRHLWHSLFDVESLCIFDLRAIDEVEICRELV